MVPYCNPLCASAVAFQSLKGLHLNWCGDRRQQPAELRSVSIPKRASPELVRLKTTQYRAASGVSIPKRASPELVPVHRWRCAVLLFVSIPKRASPELVHHRRRRRCRRQCLFQSLRGLHLNWCILRYLCISFIVCVSIPRGLHLNWCWGQAVLT